MLVEGQPAVEARATSTPQVTYTYETFGKPCLRLCKIADAFLKVKENADEFSGACNQVIQGYAPDWVRTVKVIGQDGPEHGSWSDEDGNGIDDSTGFMACQSDLN